jgi:CubicO group peptidase (beta-lactamase class C family)
VERPDLAGRWSAAARRTLTEAGLPGISAAVGHGGDVVWTYAAGDEDRERRVPTTPETLFRIASISKLFAAVAAMMLVEGDKRLSLDQPIRHYVANFPSEKVTIRQVLCHGSGAQRETPDDPGWAHGDFRLDDDFKKAIGEMRLPFQPMERWKYSNLAYSVLGEVIETVAGESYTSFVTREVIDALGLSSTSFDPTGDLADRRARGYIRGADVDWAPEDEKAWRRFPAAAAGLFSTPSDLCRFCSFLIGATPGPLSAEALASMRRPVLFVSWEQAHGLGPMLIRNGNDTLAGHSGGLFGFAAWMLGSAASGNVAVAVTNVGDGEGLLPLVKTLVTEAGDELGSAIPHDVTPPPPEAAELLGRYQGDGMVLVLAWRGGKLLAEPQTRLQLSEVAHELEVASERPVFLEGPYAGEEMSIDRGAGGEVVGFEVCTYRFVRI